MPTIRKRDDDTQTRNIRDIARDVVREESDRYLESIHSMMNTMEGNIEKFCATKIDIEKLRSEISDMGFKCLAGSHNQIEAALIQHKLDGHRASLIPKPIYSKKQIAFGASIISSITGFLTWVITYFWPK